jgi:large subunit ribosomal protein L6
MSRIGKQPVTIPPKVEVKVEGQTLKVKGPKGQLQRSFPAGVAFTVENNQIVFTRASDNREDRARHGLSRALAANMVKGVTDGFVRSLEINGVGYKAEMRGTRFIRFDLGYSHPIYFELAEGLDAEVNKNVVLIKGVDREMVGAAAATIRSFRKPEPYKGKGVKYVEERILRKVGKSGR